MFGLVKEVENNLRLAQAYKVCESMTRHHSKSFYFASHFLPPEKRNAIRALYAFCRLSDNIVDEPDDELGYTLAQWAIHAHSDMTLIDEPILLAWNDTRRRYKLSSAVINDLLAGIGMDLSINRYTSFEELYLYCYRVASTVGLLSMKIIGHQPGADDYAIKLGIALQLTNILRDVGEDARRGRIYLPLDELEGFGLSEQDILMGCHDERYQALIKYQIKRAEQIYKEAWPGIFMLHQEGQFAVAAAAEIYRAILPAIEANQYNNHSKRAFVPTWKKLMLLPQIWVRLKI